MGTYINSFKKMYSSKVLTSIISICKIKNDDKTWIETEGSGRPKKLNNEHHLFILNLIHSYYLKPNKIHYSLSIYTV